MKKIGLICLTLCLLIALSGNVFFVSGVEAGNNTIKNGAHSVDGAVPLLGTERLVSNVQTAIVYETKSQTLMYAFNADEQIYPASLVKILTALMVAEQVQLSDSVTVTEAVLSSVAADAVSADLVAGEVLTVADLLHCMMVASANDAAAVLADYVSGSQDAFVAEMNQYAQELGCTQTNFTNVHGLHDDQQYTTTRDMARILAKAMENETFCDIFGAIYYTVPATNMSEERSLSTGNYLMNNDSVKIYHDSRVTGGRTAVTDSGYISIASSAETNGMELICIVTGAQSVYREDGYTVQTFGGYNETSLLLNSGFEGFETKQVIYAGQALEQYSVENGMSDVVVGAMESVSTVLPKDVGIDRLDFKITKITEGIKAPIEENQVLSVLEVWYGSTCVGHMELSAFNPVPMIPVQTVEDIGKTAAFPWKTVLIAVICTLVGVLVIWIVIRGINGMRRAARRNHSRQYRRNRRRSR